jgi:hypothetical protein
VLSLVALACIALAPIAGMRVLAACTIAVHLVGYALPDGAWSWPAIMILLILPRVLEGWIVLRIASAVDGRAARALATACIAAAALAGLLFCVLANATRRRAGP